MFLFQHVNELFAISLTPYRCNHQLNDYTYTGYGFVNIVQPQGLVALQYYFFTPSIIRQPSVTFITACHSTLAVTSSGLCPPKTPAEDNGGGYRSRTDDLLRARQAL